VATTVSFGNDPKHKFITTYLRLGFQLDDPASMKTLLIRMLRDDGAVVYLNGTEVFRSNMPEGAITSTTLASRRITGTGETAFHSGSVDPKLLVQGRNVVAVEVHQAAVTSSDLSFDMELIGNAPIPTEPAAATLVITGPKDGATFTAPATVLINSKAVDPKSYITRVEFFANEVSIGVSQIMFFRAPNPGTPVEHSLEWRNVPGGKYTIVAKAKDSKGALVTSPPVMITVLAAASPPPIKPQAMAQGLRVVFEGVIGQRYSIQVSSDLQQWREVGSVQSTTGQFEYVDPAAESTAHQFYRAVPVP
jgi:hypothetical protein